MGCTDFVQGENVPYLPPIQPPLQEALAPKQSVFSLPFEGVLETGGWMVYRVTLSINCGYPAYYRSLPQQLPQPPVIAGSVSAEAIWCSSGLSPFCQPEAQPKDLPDAGHEAKICATISTTRKGFQPSLLLKKENNNRRI